MSLTPAASTLRAAHRARSSALGLAYFAVPAASYLASFVMMFSVEQSWLRAALAVGNGIAIAILFVVGHDAVHGSLTPSGRLNRLLGVLALLPSWHPYQSWAHTHNGLHHGWTNLKGRDPVYCPFSYDEFIALPAIRRHAERVYRTLPGLGLLYLIEIWWKLEVAPAADARNPAFRRDRRYVLLFIAAQLAGGAALMTVAGAADVPLAERLLLAGAWILVPFAVWNWMMGFATVQHHTHPRVRWYGSEAEWNRHRAQIDASVHVVFPRWANAALCHIMDHTAHHIDPRIPLYNLAAAQHDAEASYDGRIVVDAFSFQALRTTLKICKLYDFERHRWLDFEGRVTAVAGPDSRW